MIKFSQPLWSLLIAFFLVNTISAQNKSFNINDSSAESLKSSSISEKTPKPTFQNASKSRELFINPIIQNSKSIQVNDTIQLDLFENKQYKAYIDKVEVDVNGTSVIRARLAGFEYGSCIISTFNGKSFMTIEVPEKNELYMSKFDRNSNKYFLLQIDKSKQKALEGAAPIIPPKDDPQNDLMKKNSPQDLLNINPLKKATIESKNIQQSQSVISDANTPETITLMIVYTPAAAAWSAANETDINNTISLLMAKAQLALDNSNTLLNLNLVYTAQISYTELNNDNDLLNLTNTNDGIMDEVHQWRDANCADVVVLLEDMDYAGGMGWLLNSTSGMPDYSFSINRVQQASWTYSTIHEIGHNMGCHHPKTQNLEPGPGLFPYSAGWRWNGTAEIKYCDIMTYENGSYFADGINATTVPFFSNPDIQFQGISTGNSVDGDNARTIREMKSVIAAYRHGCSNCTPPTTQATALTTSSITDNSITIGWTRGSGDAVLVVARQADALSSAPENDMTYTAGASFGSGTQIGFDNYVVYNGTGTSVNITRLSSGTGYNFDIYEYNSVSNCYLLQALSGNGTTSGNPPKPGWIQTNGPEGGLVRCMISSGSDIFAATNGGIYHSTDYGQSWVSANTGLISPVGGPSGVKNLPAIITTLAINGNTIFAGAHQSGRLYVSTDNGQSWNTSNSGLTSEYVYSLAVSGNNIFAGTFDGGVFLSVNNGQSWSAVNTGLPNSKKYPQQIAFIKALAVNGNNIFAGTSDGEIYLSTNYGQSWSAVNTGLLGYEIMTITVSGNNIFAGTWGSGVFLSTNNGQSWSAVNSGLTSLGINTMTCNGNNIFAGATTTYDGSGGEYLGGVFSSTDNGQNWSAVGPELKGHSIWSLVMNGDNIFAGTYGGGIFRSTNNGQSWSAINSGMVLSSINTLAFKGNDIFAGTEGGGIFLSANQGQSWSSINSGLTNPMINALAVNGNNIFAGTQGGGIFLSANNGGNWVPMNAGIANKFVQELLVSGNNIFAGTYNFMTLEGGLFRSKDNGQTWSELNAGLTDNRIFSMTASADTIFAGTYGGGIFRSTDSGENWVEVNTGLTDKLIYSLAIKGKTIFAGTLQGGIFRSTDDGLSWSAVGLGGYVVNSLAVSNDAVFACALDAVYLSRNNGESWEKVDAGLNNTNGIGSLAINNSTIFAGVGAKGLWKRPLSEFNYDALIKQDSLTLVALYNATGGPNWTRKANWLTGPVENWEGVTFEEGRVVKLNFGNASTPAAGLVGTLPVELSNLTAIREISMERNQLSGSLPSSWSTLVNLQTLFLGQNQITGNLPSSWSSLINLRGIVLMSNQLTGNLPDSWSSLVNLRGLYINNNQLTGNLPDSWSSLVNLQEFYLSGNQLTGNVPDSWVLMNHLHGLFINNNRISRLPDFSSLTNLTDIDVSYNLLDFGDIGPNMGIPNCHIIYSPQAPIGEAGTIIKNQGQEFRISVTVGGSSNIYQWYKNGAFITNATGTEYLIPSVSLGDAGDYTCQITNTVATELTLQSQPITLQIANTAPIANAGIDQSVNAGAIVYLDGSVSFDPDGDSLTFIWFGPPEDFFIFTNTAITSFTAPEVMTNTNFTFSLIVNDGTLSSTMDQVVVLIKQVNKAPTANAGTDQSINEGGTVTLDGTASTDPDNDVLTYFWTAPDGITLNSATVANPTIIAPDVVSDTFYTFSLVVNDGSVDSQPDSVNILIKNIDLTQTLNFNAGWNIMSLYVMPKELNLDNILQPIIDEGKLKKVMNEKGEVIEDWGYFGGWQNTIVDLKNTEGYKINVTSPVTLEVTGIPTQLPLDILLNTGWNIISWPSSNEQNGMDVFQTLITEGKLKKVMDESGKVIEDWGYFGGWQNSIGNFKPGEGYKVNVTSDCTLTINENGTKSKVIIPELIASTHFIPAYKGNGTDHMNINLVNLAESGIMEGDEIGIFDGSICVGSSKIVNHPPIAIGALIVNQNSISIPVSAIAGIESGINGFTEGNSITLKLFRNGRDYPLILQPLKLSNIVFEKGESMFAMVDVVTDLEGLSISDLPEINCYPNPFSDEVTVEIKLKTDAQVEVEVLNQLGQMVKYITTKQLQQSGLHKLTWNGRNENNQSVSPGIYHLKVNIDGTIIHKKIVYSK